jgi:hypothetical protein
MRDGAAGDKMQRTIMCTGHRVTSVKKLMRMGAETKDVLLDVISGPFSLYSQKQALKFFLKKRA